ncbi:MAG TPA: hypothetical protein VHO95_11345 [Candidatus Dormibacteraeota bacterium]|nr:hypothetical protein [Candidatus Dormibacteraeota bacterium]
MTFEIVTERAGLHVHHPLSEDNIHALLASFPADVQPFVRRVHRRPGLHERQMRGRGTERDPFTGRYGFEDPKGVWEPRLRGRFRHDDSEIDLFAYVYDEAMLRQPDSVKATLWLQQATTLAHEVAHAWDLFGRSGRDRWRNDEHNRAGQYAEQTQTTSQETVVQYFATACPDLA